MRKTVLVVAILLATGPAMAQTQPVVPPAATVTMNPVFPGVSVRQGAALGAGMFAGAVAGAALIGGALGAVIGGASGILVGNWWYATSSQGDEM